MTEENSKEYVDIIEEKLLENQEEVTEDVLPEVMAEAYMETKDLEVVPSEPLPEPSGIMTRGANKPTASRLLDVQPMPGGSNIFSGSGWRYSGYSFFFRDIRANPYFGVSVTGDSFNFHNIFGGKDAVYPGYTYYFPTVPTHGGASRYTYFSTYNPVYGSKYYIW
jgi:hypothetical protein